AIGHEGDAGEDYAKLAKRQEAIAEGKTTGEQFDAAFAATPKAYYVQLFENFEGALQSVDALAELCETRFADAAPGFGRLRGVIEEVRQAAKMLLARK